MDDGADWPTTDATEIQPNLWMGGLAEDEYIGRQPSEAHYAFASDYEVVVTLYADAQPAPWGVTEYRYGFPDDDIPEHMVRPVLPLAHHGWGAWQAGARVLVRCQQGVNRSGLVTVLILMLDGMTATEAIALVRDRRGPAVLNNTTFERWLLVEATSYLTIEGDSNA